MIRSTFPRYENPPQPDWDLQDPTPAEIQRACLQIQAQWSHAERHVRATVRTPADLELLIEEMAALRA
jgi:hypothetical protein